MLTGLIITGSIITIAYIIVILSIEDGFRKENLSSGVSERSVSVSVIVACRNEESGIAALLDSLTNQHLPDLIREYEVIVVNDYSDDRTAEIVSEYCGKGIVTLLDAKKIENNGCSKKKSLRIGVGKAKGELLVFTDGDCVPSVHWIESMVRCYLNRKGKARMIAAAVVPFDERSLLSDIQLLECCVLMGVTAGAIRSGRPLMCNGANLLIEKAVWEAADALQGGEKYASGDDMFLLEKVKRHYGSDSIYFCLSGEQSLVRTSGLKTWKSVSIQRLRWVSKAPAYTDKWILFVAGLVFMMNFFLLISFLGSIFFNSWILVFVVFFGVKNVTDFRLVHSSIQYFGKSRLMLYYLPLQFLGIFYVSLAAILGVFLNTSWKGRSSNRRSLNNAGRRTASCL